MPTSASAAAPDTLAANVAALIDVQPGFILPPSDDRVRLSEGVWRLFDEANGTGAAIHSRDPQREADRAADELLAGGTPEAIVAIGLGLGFLLDALERRGWAGTVLAFEPAPRTVRPMLGRRDVRAWIAAGRLRIVLGPEFLGVGESWRWFSGDTPVPVYVNPALARVRATGVARAREVIARLRYDAAANAAARRDHGARYLLNTLRNLPAIAGGGDVAALFESARGIPAVVVAAGPSLDAALPALSQVRDSALVIAVDTALRPLLQAGIHPHIVVAVDPSDINGRHLMDLPPCPDTFFVAEGSIDPYAVGEFRGRTFFFNVSDHQPWPWIAAAGRTVGRLRAFGSVLTSAFDLALKMKCDPLIFAGADLSYTNGRPYGRGVTYEEDWQRRAVWGEPLEQQWREAVGGAPETRETDVTGSDVLTAPHLVAFRNWLVEQIAVETGTRVVNATGGGILCGARIEQCAPEQMASLVSSPRPALRALVRERYRAVPGRIDAAAVALLAGADRADAEAGRVLAEWLEFAPGLTRDAVLAALTAAASATAPGPGTAAGTTPQPTAADVDAGTLQQLAAAMPLVSMPIPPYRMQAAAGCTRVFRFRSLGARILCSAARPLDAGVTENGRPLARRFDLNDLEPASYVAFRDEVHFRATDESDPRWNGRTYTLLVPAAVAHLESLPLHDLLSRNL